MASVTARLPGSMQMLAKSQRLDGKSVVEGVEWSESHTIAPRFRCKAGLEVCSLVLGWGCICRLHGGAKGRLPQTWCPPCFTRLDSGSLLPCFVLC